MGKKVAFEFQGVDSGVSSMISKLRQQSKQMGADLIGDAQKYSKATKDQLGYIEDTIKAIQRRNALDQKQGEFVAKRRFESASSSASTPLDKQKAEDRYKSDLSNLSSGGDSDRMQVDLLRELIETTKLTAKEEIAANKEAVVKSIKEVERKVARGEGVDQEELLKANIQKDILNEGRKKEDRQQSGVAGGVFKGMLGFELFKQLISGAQQFTSARSENDLIEPALSIIPGAGGLGNLLARSFEEQDKILTQEGVNKGLTGHTRVDRSFYGNTTKYGLDYTETAKLTEDVLRAKGSINGLNTSVQDAAGLQFAYGLNQGDVLQQIKNERLTGGSAGDNVVNMLKDAIKEGILSEYDRTLLGELLQNQTQVVQMFGKSSIAPSNESARAAMLNLNKFGGSFSANDPRFMDRFSTVQNSLTNPGNDFINALQFQAIRNIPGMENSSMFDMLKAREKGTETEGYQDSFLNLITQGGGNEDFKKMAIRESGLVNSYEDAEQMYNNRGKSSISSGNVSNLRDQTGAIADEARGNVSPKSISSAEITNGFINSFGEGFKIIGGQFFDIMSKSTSEVSEFFTSEIKNAIKKGFRDGVAPPSAHDPQMN